MTWRARFGAARVALAMVLATGVLFATSDTSQAETLLVTNPNDSGPGSLREAITMANQDADVDTIEFALPPPDTQQGTDVAGVVDLAAPLPPIIQPLVIDGTTQPGYDEAARPVLEVRGELGFVADVEMPVWDGLVFDAGSTGSTVQGLSFTQFARAIVLLSDNNSVRLNWVGLGADEVPRSNITGIRVEGAGNTIGRGNVIVFSEEDGVSITGTNNVVVGNRIGIDHEDAPAGNDSGVYMGITAGNNRVGGTDPLDRNIVSGNDIGVYSDSTTVQNVIVGNYIGTDSTGTFAVGNGTGIELDNSPATIGGTTPGAGNVISGNFGLGTGIAIVESSGSVVQGNFIGTDATGTVALGNGGAGVDIDGGLDYLIGGTEAGAGNLISGNGVFGDGAFFSDDGIQAFGVEGLTVQGNVIGANATADAALSNDDGIDLNLTTGALIGGTEPGAGNVISGNDDNGIEDQGEGTVIQGNFIGVTRDGGALGNGGSGVRIEAVEFPRFAESGPSAITPLAQVGAGPTEVGGPSTGTGNVIAFNGDDGVTVGPETEFSSDNDGNSIRLNSIHDNGDLGIDLGDDGVTANDPGDADDGPNDLQNFPDLQSVIVGDGSITIDGVLDTVEGSYLIDFYGNDAPDPSGFGEGETYLGSTTVTIDSGPVAFTAEIPVTVDPGWVTATATNTLSLDTSEFSEAIATQTPVAITTQASSDVTVGGSIFDTATVTGDVGSTSDVRFRLYGPDDADCSTPIFTSIVPLDGPGEYQSEPFVTSAAGTYRWVAEYRESNETLLSTPCDDPNEAVVVERAVPTLTTQASASGLTVSDSATLSGGFNPTGTITFSVYGPNNASCAPPPLSSSTVPVTGNGTYNATPVNVTQPGVYRWIASYSGDANNEPVIGACNAPNESATVTSTTTTSTSTSTTSTTMPTTTTTSSTTTTTSTSTTTSTTTTSTTTTLPPTTTTSTSTTSTTTPAPTTTTSTTAPPPTTTTTVAPTTTTSTITTTTTTTLPPTGTTTTAPLAPVSVVTTVPIVVPTTTPFTTAPTTTLAATTTTAAPTTTTAPPTTTTTRPPPPPPPTGPSLEAVNPDGQRSGPPGVGLDVSGGPYPCSKVYFFLDDVRIGTDTTDEAGFVDADGLAVPGDTDPGQHQITSSCNSSRDEVLASTTFLVTDADIHRSGFATSLPNPDQVSFDFEQIVTSAAVAGLVILLFAFPSKLFNSAVEENYDEIRGWFRMPARGVDAASTASRTASFFLLNLVAGIALGFLSPDFGLNRNSVVLAIAFTLSLIVMSAGWSLPAAIGIHRRTGEWGKLNFLPGTLLVSVVMVFICRWLHIQPGYFYGALAGLAFASALSQRSQGRLVAANWTWALAISLAAWFLRAPVSEQAAQPDASLLWIGLEAFLVMTFLWGVETVAVAMLPMRFLDGPKVKAWNRLVWGALLFAGVFITVHVLLTPTSGYVGQTAEEVTVDVLIVFGIFCAVSLAAWAYFRYRPQRWIPGQAS